MPNSDKEPKIITGEKEAREEYRRLTSFGFAVHQPGRLLDEEGFITAIEDGVSVWVKRVSSSGDVVDTDTETFANLYGRLDPHLAYTTLIGEGLYPYEPGKLLEEDEFILVASEIGGVDLARTRSNGQIFRTYGTVIGYSNSGNAD